jgi:hypothetical protein
MDPLSGVLSLVKLHNTTPSSPATTPGYSALDRSDAPGSFEYGLVADHRAEPTSGPIRADNSGNAITQNPA